MFRVLTISEASSSEARAAIAEAQAIMRAQFPGMPEADIAKLPAFIGNPFKYRFIGRLCLAQDAEDRTRAVAVLLYAGDLHFAWLDIISTEPRPTRGGLGAALYEHVREDARTLGARGLYFECLPDDPALSPDPATRRQNAARLKFYERFGARPIMGTAYETPVKPGDTDSPYLVFDGLDRFTLPDAPQLKAIMRAILERKYGELCPPAYIDAVVRSVGSGASSLRPQRYLAAEGAEPAGTSAARIVLVIGDRHQIHHVRERGYVEAPVRIPAILKELDRTTLFERRPHRHFGDRHIREVHSGRLVDYIERACADAPAGKSVYPYVFPIRNPTRMPQDRSVLAGYWCIDTFTPLNANVWPAAREAVDCTLTAAEAVAQGARAAYALIRPPGHHAERRAFGGFCYFSNAAIAANYLAKRGRVAMLDLDYHHGNGQQDIFYERDDVLTVSIHGHPRFAYPYFSGFADETGRGPGTGFNLNLPLAEQTTPDEHRQAVEKALRRIARHEPDFLVLALGFDTAKGDPTGTWNNRAADFRKLGKMIGASGWRTLVVQEGGYRVRTLGINARNFFTGLAEGMNAPRKPSAATPARRKSGRRWRRDVRPADIDAVRRLVEGTGKFSSGEVDIAAELVGERLAKGAASGYDFLFLEEGGRLLGYACFGPTPGTENGFDLYWIAVAAGAQGKGLGRTLHDQVEAAIRAAAGARIYVDTSSRPDYAPTRAIYEALGYRRVALLEDFYREGDGKAIYMKAL